MAVAQATRWNTITARAGRESYPALLMDYFDELDMIDRAKAVCESWTMPEFPVGHLPEHDWVSLFEEVGFCVSSDDGVMLISQEEHFNTPTIRVYRGALREGRDAMAWTTSRKVAQWFANRCGGRVYTADVNALYVLAAINDRSESEVVLNISAALEDGAITFR